jgi:hypothetical protein
LSARDMPMRANITGAAGLGNQDGRFHRGAPLRHVVLGFGSSVM